MSAIEARMRDSAERVLAVVSTPQPEPDLPIILQLALLQMAEFDRQAMLPPSIFKGCQSKLREDCQDAATLADFAALRSLGHCEKLDGARYHTLTEEGRRKAKSIAQAICRAHGLHLMLPGEAFITGRMFNCVCGAWSITQPGGDVRKARSAFNRHVEHAARRMTQRRGRSLLSEAGNG